MKVKVIINPSSGRQIVQKHAQQIIDKLVEDKTFRQVDITQTTGAGDAYELARTFQPWQTDLILAVGGDGTLNEVINGMLDGGQTTPLAMLPAGTVNDFAFSLGIPREVDEYCKMLRRFNTIWSDVGKAGNKYFLNVAAGGILTDVAYKTTSDAKTVLGQLAYVFSGAMDLPQQLWQTVPVSITADNKIIDDEIMLFIVSNSKSVGGFRNLAPDASITDGLLDVLVVHKQSWIDFLPLLVRLVNGEHLNHKSISYFQTRKLEIVCNSNCSVPLDLDGEQGDTLPVKIKSVPSAIKLVIP